MWMTVSAQWLVLGLEEEGPDVGDPWTAGGQCGCQGLGASCHTGQRSAAPRVGSGEGLLVEVPTEACSLR